ncbi:MAG TPA: IS200/IS605 family transposase [Candidatus Hydrogenedentes bacterium]|nr:IS200/IS605 family transposase [Candidatus Hydrogenedentota bacterium]HOS02601.1 IS200/IS605 family transposase [Candidatus Hydrogenedentota bacterium]
MSHAFCSLTYHIVFSTKDRRPLLVTDMQPRLHEYLGGTVRGLGSVALAVGGTDDHVHILARLRQDRAISDVLREIKTAATHWIHGEFPDMKGFFWQAGYGAFTVSASQAEKVAAYITHQTEHHKKQSFEDEFVALLTAHAVEFDPKYIWQ